MNNLQIIKNYHKAIWDAKNIHAVDEFFDTDVIVHSPVETTKGTQRMKAVLEQWYIGFPNLKVFWDDFICEENKVVCRWRAEGKHEGEFLRNQPTNKIINYVGVTIYHFDNDKIKEYWAYVDMHNILLQIQRDSQAQ